MSFEVLDSSGDVVVAAVATGVGTALVEVARRLTAVWTAGSAVEGVRSVAVAVDARDAHAAVVAYVNELVYLFDAEGFLAAGGQVSFTEAPSGVRILGTLVGDSFDPARHARGVEVKAATFHGLEFVSDAAGCRVRVLLDL